MVRTLRFLGACLALLLVAARVEAASVTLAWDANSETNLSGYYVGYRTSPTGSETLVNVGNVTTWTLTTASAGNTYYFRVYAENTSGLRSAPSTEVSTTIPNTPPPPSGGGLVLERGALNFGAVNTSGTAVGAKTPGQRMMVSQISPGTPIAWTASSTGTGSSRLTVSPSSGSGTAPITVTLASTSLAAGTYTNNVRVTVGTTQLNVPVTTRVYAPGASAPPAGVFDTPTNGIVNVAGSLPVTGWAVDDVGIARVDILRDAVGSEPAGAMILLGSAALVSGSRPDVENLYPNAPQSYRAGWGFMVLTNMLPDTGNGRATGGNGAFRLHAYAVDTEGRSSYLGAKSFRRTTPRRKNPSARSIRPHRAGRPPAVHLWSGAGRSHRAPRFRRTVRRSPCLSTVWHAATRPITSIVRTSLACSPGTRTRTARSGTSTLDTTTLANGTHTISWVVTDNQGNTEGIGSRFFTVQNGTSSVTALTSTGTVDSSSMAVASNGAALGQTSETVAEVPPDYSLVEVRKVASDDRTPELVFPEWSGEIRVRTRETEQVEVRLASQFDDGKATYEGYVVIGGRMRPLPVGASLDTSTGTFTWQPGPGFLGRYEFVFLRTGANGLKTRIPVHVRIAPRHDSDNRR